MKRQDGDAGNKGQGYGAEKVPGDYGGWGIRQGLKDDRKHCTYLDLCDSPKGRPKLSAARQKSAGEPSSATENLSRGSSLFSETYFLTPWHKQMNSRQ